jgi:hypothetical protein
MLNDLMQQPVTSNWESIDPTIFAQIQQIAQMLGAAGSQMVLQQQGQAQAIGQDQVAVQTTVQ